MKKIVKVPEKYREKYKGKISVIDPVSLEDEEVDRSYVCNDIESAFLNNPVGSAKELEKLKKEIHLYRTTRRIKRVITLAIAMVFIGAMMWLIIGLKLNNKDMKPKFDEIKDNKIEKLIEHKND